MADMNDRKGKKLVSLLTVPIFNIAIQTSFETTNHVTMNTMLCIPMINNSLAKRILSNI